MGRATELIPHVVEALMQVPQEVLDLHVLKVLQAKEKLGLHENRMTELSESLMSELHHPDAITLIESMSTATP